LGGPVGAGFGAAAGYGTYCAAKHAGTVQGEYDSGRASGGELARAYAALALAAATTTLPAAGPLGEACEAGEEGGGALAEAGLEVWDGVRRARAALEAGNSSIPAQMVNPDDTLGPVFDASVGNLYSPFKDTIADDQRWDGILSGMRNGDTFPAILVRPGSRGVPIGGGANWRLVRCK
jgi:hypothetical protein